MNIVDILDPRAVCVPVAATMKKLIIDEMIDTLVAADLVGDGDDLKKAVWERERQRSTGIGDGLAIPHGKSASLDHLVLAVGRPADPVDFESIDNRPVKLIFMLLSPPDRTAEHIQALSRISKLMLDTELRAKAYGASDAESLYDLIATGEQALAT